MPRRQSAGVIAYRRTRGELEVFLVHPGGPFWQRKSIPKGELGDGESPEIAARREFNEETGFSLSQPMIALKPVKQKSGKIVHPFALEADFDADAIRSNTFALEWPPRSGEMREFPEVDRAAWFTLTDAQRKILDAQRAILIELSEIVDRAR